MPEPPEVSVTAWLVRFERAWRGCDESALADCFSSDSSYWRDCLAVTGALGTVSGSTHIASALMSAPWRASNFRIADGRTPPRFVSRAGVEVIEAIVEFDGHHGPACGVLRLIVDPRSATAAWVWHTSLSGLHRLATKPRNNPDPPPPTRTRPLRDSAQSDRDQPAVLVVGAGHAGLGAAACLTHLGVTTLVIDRLQRVGDVWRNRYDSLVLHNESHLNDLPHLPFPPGMPRFLPRDTIADWLETYAARLDLHVSTSTELLSASRDGDRWSVVVRRGRQQQVLRPRHVVMAVGSHAVPRPLDESGLDGFAGTVVHSSSYRSGLPYTGQRALVLGTGSSAHDIAQDLHRHGAQVTMVQRSPTLVVSLEQAQKVYAIQAEGLPVADSDLLSTATPYPVLVQANQIFAAAARDADRALLDGLAARGFRLDDGAPDAAGFQLKLLRRGGGYYVNVGCSELIADGQIALLPRDSIDCFTITGARLHDGTVVEADLVVAGTGYLQQQDVVRRSFGAETADRVGSVAGTDEHGEQRNMWRRTTQPGLWFTGNGFPQARMYSPYLALQISMVELGLLPATAGLRPEAAAQPDSSTTQRVLTKPSPTTGGT